MTKNIKFKVQHCLSEVKKIMKGKIILKNIFLFLLGGIVVFAIHTALVNIYNLPRNYDIHFLLFIMSFIVVLSVNAMFWLGFYDKIGFAYLGFVVFKMFGVGYLAFFEKDFKENIILFFILFWMYLFMEAWVAVSYLVNKNK